MKPRFILMLLVLVSTIPALIHAATPQEKRAAEERNREYNRMIKDCNPKGGQFQQAICGCLAKGVETVMPLKAYNQYMDSVQAERVTEEQARQFLGKIRESQDAFVDCLHNDAQL